MRSANLHNTTRKSPSRPFGRNLGGYQWHSYKEELPKHRPAPLQKGKRKAVLPVVILLFLPLFVQAQHTTVPLNHRVYAFLQKSEPLQLFDSYQLRVRPITRAAALALLQEIDAQREQLSNAEQQLLTQFLGEFRDLEIGEAAAPNSEIHLYRYEEGEAQIFVDARVQQTVRFSRNRFEIDAENNSETLASGAIRGRFGEHFFFDLQARNTAILGEDDLDENFDADDGQIRSVVGSTVFNDQATGYVSARFGRFAVLLGRNTIAWGSRLGGQLALADANEPMDLLQLSLDFRRFRFSSFHAKLQGIADQRYLAGHRLDYRAASWLHLGVYETVIYAGRGIEPGYLNPLVPYHIIEHQLGDKDNNMLGFDWNAFVMPGVRVYGEIFLDDFSFDKSLGTYWGNKLAYLAGAHWAQPFGLKTVELSGDFTRVDPFVYTHHDSLNVYAHYGVSLGAKIGPNAERWRAGLTWQPLRDARWQISYTWTRKGRGDIFTAHRNEEGEAKGYLRDALETFHDWHLALDHQIKRDVFAGFAITLRDRKNTARIAGNDRWERFARFYLDVNW